MTPDKYLRKEQLEHGEYYAGTCRNASVARWDGKKETFTHWRTKFGATFLEEIKHPEDEFHYDVFYPMIHISPPKPIPLGDQDAPVRTIPQDPPPQPGLHNH